MIRGVALTNARVTVTQNGSRLDETTVAPGAFEIDDQYATGYGGNLLETITEADGSQRSFTVPYASVVQLLRPGVSRLNFVLGQLGDAEVDRHPNDIFNAAASPPDRQEARHKWPPVAGHPADSGQSRCAVSRDTTTRAHRVSR